MPTTSTFSISNLYRVHVQLPEKLHEFLHGAGDTAARKAEWEKDVLAATRGALNAGSVFYGQHEEWAEFDTKAVAMTCGAALLTLISRWTIRAEQESRATSSGIAK